MRHNYDENLIFVITRRGVNFFEKKTSLFLVGIHQTHLESLGGFKFFGTKKVAILTAPPLNYIKRINSKKMN